MAAIFAGSAAAGTPTIGEQSGATGGKSVSGQDDPTSAPTTTPSEIAPITSDASFEPATAANDNDAPSAEDVGDEDDHAQEQEGNPESQPQETATSAEQPPAPSSEPVNDNSPVDELPTTGTE